MFSTPIKQISIYIPADQDPPPAIVDFSPEENLAMLKVGSEAIITSKKCVISTTDIDVATRELCRDYDNKLDLLNKSLEFQQKLNETIVLQEEEKIRDQVSKTIALHIEKFEYIDTHNKQEIENLRRQLLEKEMEFSKYREQLKNADTEIHTRVDREVANRLGDNVIIYEKTIEKYETLQRQQMEETQKNQATMKVLYDRLSETEKELEKYRQKCENVLSEANYRVEKELNTKLKTEYDQLKETIEALSKRQTNNVSVGDKGENIFEEYAMKTFRDFEDFQLENVSTKYYKGDFHMHFKKFSIMVDTKYYTNGIDKTQRDKIKRDMQQNQHIKFGWIVSLDTSIQKYNKAPFQFEWTSDNRCICYINQFLKQQDPSEVLRALWFSCNLIFEVAMDNETEQNEIRNLKKNEQRVKEIAEKLLKLTKERDLTLMQFKENFEMTDKCIREILNTEINNVFEEHYNVVHQWWEIHITACEGHNLTINKIFKEFKKAGGAAGTGGGGAAPPDINEDYFKTIVFGFVDEKDIVRSKSKNGKVDVLNVSFKT